jgi:hypothetical protein
MKIEARIGITMVMALVAFGGCGSGAGHEDANNTEPDITSQELAAGAAYDGSESEPADDAPVDDTTTPEDDAGTPGDSTSIAAVTGGCNSAFGYSHGKATAICTTTVDGKPVEVSTAATYRKMQDDARAAGVIIGGAAGLFESPERARARHQLPRRGRLRLAHQTRRCPRLSPHRALREVALGALSLGV